MSAVLPQGNERAELSDAAVLHLATVVTAADVARRYGSGDTAVDALRGVSLQVDKGELVAVMGPSGSGKSTLMHILAGLDKPTSGSVTIAGREIASLSDNELTKLRRAHIGFVFQFFNLLPMLTAEENVTLPQRIAGQKVDREWLDAVLEQVGIDERRTHRPSELSGGQQQRVAMARAMATDPALLLLDEVTAALDPELTGEVLEIMRRLAGAGTTMVLATHEMTFARDVATKVCFLHDGAILEQGTPAEIFEHPREERTRQFLRRVLPTAG